MLAERVRRIAALFLVAALAIGVVTHAVHASDMSLKMTLAAANMAAMPDDCSSCAGDDGMPAVCFAVCSNVAALLPFGFVFSAAAVSSPAVPTTDAIVGLRGPPDPYPPKPTGLS